MAEFENHNFFSYQDEEAREANSWKMGDYTGDVCPNCGRIRVCKCSNGKRRCEKCNWVIDDKNYCPIQL